MARIIVPVISGWQMWRRRARCLHTWMAEARKYPDNLDCMFVMACSAAGSVERYGEYLFVPADNHRDAMPRRLRVLCTWALTQPDWEYMFKVDDDVRIHVPRLLAYPLQSDYIGYPIIEWCGSGQDYLGEARFRSVANPALYAGGGAFFMSRRAVQAVADNLIESEGPDDLFVGRILRKAGMPLTVDGERFHNLAPRGLEPGPDNNLMCCSPHWRDPE